MMTLRDFGTLHPAEQCLLADAARGTPCVFDHAYPEAPTAGNVVRASFIRFLALGGDETAPVYESGLRVSGAYIEGVLNLDGAKDVRPLWLQDCTLKAGFSLSDARTKVISLDRSFVHWIRGDGVEVDGSLLLRRTVIEETLKLFGAEITGTLSCDGCMIKGRPWRSQRLAVDLSTITIGGNVEFRRGFSANGIVLLDDSEIGGLFDCGGGRFRSGFDQKQNALADPWDKAVRAMKCHRLNLKGSLYLRDCDCEGELSFSGAQIGGDLDCRNGHFRRAGDGHADALRFTRIEAGGNISLSAGFRAEGKVQLNGARVRGNIDCRGGRFSVPASLPAKDFAAPSEAFSEDAMSLVNARVKGALILAEIEGSASAPAVFDGSIDLKSAFVSVLVDDSACWPVRRKRSNGLRHVIHLDGFTYDRFAGLSPIDAKSRRRWLECQPKAHVGQNFKPQPFEQVIKVLRNMGHPEAARRLAIERQGFLIRRRLALWRHFPGGTLRAFGALVSALTVGLLIGHGYRPLRVLGIMALVGIVFGFYFRLAADRGVFAPRDAQVFLQADFDPCRPHAGGNWTKCADTVGAKFAEYPQFNPWVYSFNVLFPIIDLYQEKAWVPMQKEVRFDLGGGRSIVVPSWGTSALVLTELVFGGVASLLAVAAFSGLVKIE